MWEVMQRMEGLAKKDRQQWHKIRVLAAILLSPHSKKRIRPEDIINLPDEVKKPIDKECIQRDIQRKTKALKLVK